MFAPAPGKTNVNKEIWLHNDIDFSINHEPLKGIQC